MCILEFIQLLNIFSARTKYYDTPPPTTMNDLRRISRYHPMPAMQSCSIENQSSLHNLPISLTCNSCSRATAFCRPIADDALPLTSDHQTKLYHHATQSTTITTYLASPQYDSSLSGTVPWLGGTHSSDSAVSQQFCVPTILFTQHRANTNTI
jgi:hypothetical protein